jgi:nucleoside diphosphate kinase
MACYYKVLSEAGEDQGAIIESASESIDKIKKIIGKIIDNIVRVGKQICKNITNKINKISIDKYYKKALEAFNSNSIEYVKFDNAYIFQNLDGSIPAIPQADSLINTILQTADAQSGDKILIDLMNKMIGSTSSPITDINELYEKLNTLFYNEKERKTVLAKKNDIDIYYKNIKDSSSTIEKMYKRIDTFKYAISHPKDTQIKGTSFVNALNAWRMINKFIKFASAIYNKFVMAMVFRTNQEISIIKKAASNSKNTDSDEISNAKTAKSESVDIETLGFMAEAMNAKERNSLSDSQFGLPEDRKYPMPDAKHVRSAIKLFGHCEESKKPQLAKRIVKFAKKYGVEIPKDSEVYKYSKK